MPETSHVNRDLFQKEIDEADELEIELAYFQHLSAKRSEELVDEEGIPFTLDPYYQNRVALEALKERAGEIQQTKELLHTSDYLDGLTYSIDETYSLALAALNGTFKQNDATKIEVVTDLLRFIYTNNMTNGLNKDLKELIQNHDIFSCKDEWMKIILDRDH